MNLRKAYYWQYTSALSNFLIEVISEYSLALWLSKAVSYAGKAQDNMVPVFTLSNLQYSAST